jgi:hypothetical protein
MLLAKSEFLARKFGQMNTKTWSTKSKSDTVNHTVHKYVYSDLINMLRRYVFFEELREIIESWLLCIFGKACTLWECFIQIYSKKNNDVGNKKTEGAMIYHVDGGEHSDDIAAVVYTLHYGRE